MASITRSLAAGLTGATVLTAVHETIRRITPATAPRMDVLGERVVARSIRAAGRRVPGKSVLHRLALGTDLVANGLFYSLVGTGCGAWWRGAGLGTIAGLSAIVLPPVLRLGHAPRGLTPRTKLMTFGYYLLGGLVAAAAACVLSDRRRAREN